MGIALLIFSSISSILPPADLSPLATNLIRYMINIVSRLLADVLLKFSGLNSHPYHSTETKYHIYLTKRGLVSQSQNRRLSLKLISPGKGDIELLETLNYRQNGVNIRE